MTHYDILGISPDASVEEIRKAYRLRIFDFHPDRNAAPEDHDFVLKLNEAYRVLSDPSLRLHYDFTLGEAGKPAHVSQNWKARVVNAFGEASGVLLLLFLAPLCQFPLAAALVLFALVLLGLFTALTLEPILASQAADDTPAEEIRTFVIATYLLLGWFLLNPFEATKEGDVLFSLALAGLMGSVLASAIPKIVEKTPSAWSLKMGSFIIGTMGASLVFLQLSGIVEEGGEIAIPGAPASELFFWLLPLTIATVVIFTHRQKVTSTSTGSTEIKLHQEKK